MCFPWSLEKTTLEKDVLEKVALKRRFPSTIFFSTQLLVELCPNNILVSKSY